MEKNNTYIKNLISKMTLEQKIGSMLTLGFAGTVPRARIYEFIEKYQCGGLRLSCNERQFGSYVDPNDHKAVVNLENKNGIRFKCCAPASTASQYKAVLDDLQAQARKRPLSIPLHFSYDQEGGSNADFSFGGINLFAKPMGIRAMDDPVMAYRIARAVAEQGKAVGFNWVHSPVLDVNSEPSNPEVYTRAYSDDAEEVAEYAMETCLGFREGRMIATGKHFPGRGHSVVDAHFQNAVIDVDEKTLWERDLLPYRKLIQAGLLPSIMIAHSIFPAIDPDNIATVSRKVLTGLLREKLGFEGVITTDSMTMGAIATRYKVANACAMALEAGADLVLMKAENLLVEETIEAIRQSILSGRITPDDLDNKVYRILQLKYEYGLFDNIENSEPPEKVLQDSAIRDLARQAARRSILIERQESGVLPVRGGRVLVIEQKVRNFNDMQWHSGIFYEACMRQGMLISHSYTKDTTDYLETSYSYDDVDRERIGEALENGGYDTIIATNYFRRGTALNRDFWEEQIEKYPKQKIIVVTNTPYEELSIPRNAKTVLLTFATSPENVRAAAAVLYGQMIPEGVWPLKYYDPGKKQKKFLICVDSDGCAMDTMTVKHMRCFGPCFIETWHIKEDQERFLQRWNEINLFSMSRGINRFLGLLQILEEFEAEGKKVKGLGDLKTWVETSPELSNKALEKELAHRKEKASDDEGEIRDGALYKALVWSNRVNQAINDLTNEEKKPFRGVRETLELLAKDADIAVMSSANRVAVEKEWKNNGLMNYVKYFFTQERGTKAECIRKLLAFGYEHEKVMMVGDAPADMLAACEAEVSFYPILPGQEEKSWEILRTEGRQRFLGQMEWKTYEARRKDKFLNLLREK